MTSNCIHVRRGVTLIEMVIYIALLSLLMTHMLSSLYTLSFQNESLIDEVRSSSGGFMATTAVIVLAVGALTFALVTLSAVAVYDDSVTAHEYRIQQELNNESCRSLSPIISAKNNFSLSSSVLAQFGCSDHI